MDFQYKGANCVVISTKEGTLITDPNLAELGAKQPTLAKVDVCLLTDTAFRPAETAEAFVIDCPGEYEVKGFAIRGIPSRSHLAKEDEIDMRTMYRLSSGDINVAVLGHIYPELTDDQLESLGMIDVLFVPVGGNGYTLDAVGAAKLVKLVDPKIVVPTHYADPELNYPVPQNGLEDFIKELGAPQEEVDKLKIKKDILGESLKVYTLKKN